MTQKERIVALFSCLVIAVGVFTMHPQTAWAGGDNCFNYSMCARELSPIGCPFDDGQEKCWDTANAIYGCVSLQSLWTAGTCPTETEWGECKFGPEEEPEEDDFYYRTCEINLNR